MDIYSTKNLSFSFFGQLTSIVMKMFLALRKKSYCNSFENLYVKNFILKIENNFSLFKNNKKT